MKLQPLGNKVLVRHEKAAEKVGSIFLPEQAKEKPVFATVIAVGEGKWNPTTIGNTVFTHEPMTVCIGDTVLVSKWGGTEVKVDGEELSLINLDDILAIINK